jgi:lipase maturation factor 1
MPAHARYLFPWALAPEDGAPPLQLFRRSGARPGETHLWPRWIFLRALGLIYFSAFYSLLFQIRGLIGPRGILPAGEYLTSVAKYFGTLRLWYAPTFLWLGSSDRDLLLLCWVGLAASALLTLNVWPRGMLMVCFLAFLSFIAAAQDFAGYQSDSMLLEAGFIALFFAPPGLWPGLRRDRTPSRLSLFLLQWLWFQIYFESGVVKLLSGDTEWRHLTAMDAYYQNGPLPTWVGWYAQHLPHRFHTATAGATLLLELVLAWMLFLPRPFRIVCFLIVTPWQAAVILTANYTFLNYLVLALGILLLDDRLVVSVYRKLFARHATPAAAAEPEPAAASGATPPPAPAGGRTRGVFQALRMSIAGLLLGWILYATAAEMLLMFFPSAPFPVAPIRALEPFRVADRFGLFAVMTRGRYEIEFQGSNDGHTWLPYNFRYKPQDVSRRPRIYAPYQPRFDWNLWFASLGSWREYPIVPLTEERLLEGSPDVIALFAGNPFSGAPPKQVRAVLWQYWFTDNATRRKQGLWWRRQYLGLYAPALEREPDGRLEVLAIPTQIAPQEDDP